MNPPASKFQRVLACAAVISVAGCAAQTPQTAARSRSETAPRHPQHVSFSLIGSALVFFDHDTGNLWAYEDAEKPATLIGKLDSFDKPLVTAAMKAAQKGEALAPPAAPTPAFTRPQPQPPANAASGSIVAEKLNAMPRNLWPSEGENQVKRDARNDWLTKNPAQGAAVFTGKIVSVRVEAGPQDQKVVKADIDVENVSIWGTTMTLSIVATFDSLTPEDVINWTDGQTITVAGTVGKATPSAGIFSDTYRTVDVTLDHAELKK